MNDFTYTEFNNESFNISDNSTTVEVLSLNPISITWQSLYIIGTVVSNSILLYIFIFKMKEKTYSNMCFISLTICDLVVGLLCLPLNVLYALPNGIILEYYFGIFLTITAYAQPPIGLFTLVLLSWHRLKQLFWPTTSSETVSKIRILNLILIWIVNYLAWIIATILFIIFGYYDDITPDIIPPPYVILILNIIFYLFPLIANIILCFVTILCLIKKRKKSHNLTASKTKAKTTSFNARQSTISMTIQNDTLSESVSKINNHRKISSPTVDNGKPKTAKRNSSVAGTKLARDTKAILCLITIIITIVLTQTMLIITWPLFVYEVVEDRGFYMVTIWLSFLNSLINPFILFIFHKNIRDELMNIIKHFTSVTSKLRKKVIG